MRPPGIVSLLLITACSGAPSSTTVVEVLPAAAQPTGEPVTVADDSARECSLAWEPRRLGASVVTISPETSSLMMAPVLVALCACTKRGSQHAIVIDFEPSRGRVTAHSADDDASLDRCLEPKLGDGLYPAIEIGSDCIDCGPKRYGVFGGPPPEPTRGARIRMPLQVDRRGDL